MIMGPDKVKISLTHYNRDIFLADEPIDNFVSFYMGPDNISESFVIDLLKNDGNQLFPRVKEE